MLQQKDKNGDDGETTASRSSSERKQWTRVRKGDSNQKEIPELKRSF